MHILGPFLKLDGCNCVGLFQGLLFHWSSCLFCAKYHVVFILALWYSLKSGIVIPPALLFLLRIALTIGDLLCFQMNFMIDFYLGEECHWNFNKDYIKHTGCFR
jgi:hypothetical protein